MNWINAAHRAFSIWASLVFLCVPAKGQEAPQSSGGFQTAPQTQAAVMAPEDRAIITTYIGARIQNGETAQYRWPNYNPGGVAYCGFVNTRTDGGNYSGFNPYLLNGAHQNGFRGNGRFLPIELFVGGAGTPSDNMVRRICAERGYDLSQVPSE